MKNALASYETTILGYLKRIGNILDKKEKIDAEFLQEYTEFREIIYDFIEDLQNPAKK